MNALIKNKAEGEFIKLLHEISKSIGLELSFEVEALQQGGIKEFFKVITKKKTKKKILLFLAGILAAVMTEVASDYVSKDGEMEQLEKEEKRLQIRKLTKELESCKDQARENIIIENINFYLLDSDQVKISRSNFYSSLLKDIEIEKISTKALDNNRVPLSKDEVISRSEFSKFIIETPNVESECHEDVTIEIIAPVFTSSDIKWKGIYQNQSINFRLTDIDFKQSVLSGDISFSHGSSIKCSIEIEKSIDSSGKVKVNEYKVFDITEVYKGDTSIPVKKKIQSKRNNQQLTFGFTDSSKE